MAEDYSKGAIEAIEAIADAESRLANDLDEQKFRREEEHQKILAKQMKKSNEEQEKDNEALKKKNRKKEYEERRQHLEEQIQIERKAGNERVAQELEARKKFIEVTDEAISKSIQAIQDAGGALYKSITDSATHYSSLLGQIETRLVGSGNTYSSVADMMSKAFAGSPYFSLRAAMDNIVEASKQGIAYNIELRATMATISEKIANTFNAFDSSLLRIIKIQQADSTQARLGMESLLTNYLNKNFQDTSYLNNLSKSVTAALVDAESTMTNKEATEFEYVVQQWLGSMSSVGVSDQVITLLAQGLGYLGSGDVSSLSSNQTLQQLLVASANKSGGRSYGDILATGATAEDVSTLLSGFRDLIEEVSNSGNIVALNQYAKIFGLSMSDLKSVLNLTEKDVSELAKTTYSYDEMLKQVNTELSKASERTGGAEMIENLLQNVIDSAGSNVGSSMGGYLSWKMAGIVADAMSGLQTGIDFQPFGVGGHANIDLGELAKGTAGLTAILTGLNDIMGAIGKPGGVNLSGIKNVEYIGRGDQQSSIREGIKKSEASYVGDMSEESIFNQSLAQGDKQANKVLEEHDEEKEQGEIMKQSMKNLDDNTDNIYNLLLQWFSKVDKSFSYSPPGVFESRYLQIDG